MLPPVLIGAPVVVPPLPAVGDPANGAFGTYDRQLDALREQYRRGLADTEGNPDPADVYKQATYTEKLRLLDMVGAGEHDRLTSSG